ncbi:hypothetical protein F2Q69_00036694 [Brassica cretica]|uniref:Serpin domain-containing protein n=1 Tax=Brassica cretica TaxID=69181 RepID=A0A8S9SVF9_BRACR|nr:hypothetical protein F2Q69_00036694 [Brassica cretica]
MLIKRSPICKLIGPGDHWACIGPHLRLGPVVKIGSAVISIASSSIAIASPIATEYAHIFFQPPEMIDFVADHPFLFLIKEDTIGTVLSAGQIMDPSDKSS